MVNGIGFETNGLRSCAAWRARPLALWIGELLEPLNRYTQPFRVDHLQGQWYQGGAGQQHKSGLYASMASGGGAAGWQARPSEAIGPASRQD